MHFDSIEALSDAIMLDVMDDFSENYKTTADVPEDLEGCAEVFPVHGGKAGAHRAHDLLAGVLRVGRQVYREQMSRYRQAGEPFDWVDGNEREPVLHFIRNAALETRSLAGDDGI